MEILNLTRSSTIYTSNAWLCSCPGPERTYRTLIDTGCDPAIMSGLEEIKRLTGHSPVDQVILTHSHYDHARLVSEIKERYNPVVHASSAYAAGIDKVLRSGDVLTCGEVHFEIIAIPGHTSDSICIYIPEEEILFSGDTPVIIWGTGNSYEQAFLRGFEEIAIRKIQTIYPGHGEIINSGVMSIIRQSLENLKKSHIM